MICKRQSQAKMLHAIIMSRLPHPNMLPTADNRYFALLIWGNAESKL
jgi:hypothetical protein